MAPSLVQLFQPCSLIGYPESSWMPFKTLTSTTTHSKSSLLRLASLWKLTFTLSDEQMQIMADEAFSGFFKGCVDAKQACPLARHNMTASALENQFWKTLFKIKYAPLRSGTQIVDYYTIKNAVTGTLYSPAQFPVLAKALDDMYSGNLTTILAMGSAGAADTADVGITPEANQGIQCSDKAVRASNRKALMPTVEKKFDISRVLGDSRIFSDMACAQWQMEAKERYEGDFQVKTKNPLLFIGNTYDALTPYQSAFNMSSGFEGSGAIEQLSFGVCFYLSSVSTGKVLIASSSMDPSPNLRLVQLKPSATIYQKEKFHHVEQSARRMYLCFPGRS